MEAVECHGLDNPDQVFFYEQDFYVLSNFSAFQVAWDGKTFPTSEHAYHWARFQPIIDISRGPLAGPLSWNVARAIADEILKAPSAHEAFRLAQIGKPFQRADWDAVKVETMGRILRMKAAQHEYVRRKLLATGERELIENSWRDDFWGWGPNRDGQNMLGKVWMEVRTELREQAA